MSAINPRRFAYAIPTDELAAERAASMARRNTEFEAACDRVGIEPRRELHPIRVGKGKATKPPPKLRACRGCGDDFIAAHHLQKLCLTCRADYAANPHRHLKARSAE